MGAHYNLLSLFAGIGGFELGLERSGGFKAVASCEINPKCRHLLKHHWPEVPAYDDVCSLTADRLVADGITVDAVCGGFPCQDISFAGNGAGLAGERSGLWREYARLIREIRPKRVIVENVAALLGRGLGDVLGDLAALGYNAWWDCIPASAVGAPHRRDRLWLVAYPGSLEHQGYGDALRRAVSAELPGAPADAGLPDGPDPEADALRPDAHSAGPHRAEIHQFGSSELRHEQECVVGPLGPNVADAEGERPRRRRAGPDEITVHCGEVGALAYAHGQRFQERDAAALPSGQNLIGGRADAGWREWLAEPNVGRVAHGVPARVDRLHGLGNAVVPEIPYRLGRAILTADAEIMAEAA